MLLKIHVISVNTTNPASVLTSFKICFTMISICPVISTTPPNIIAMIVIDTENIILIIPPFESKLKNASNSSGVNSAATSAGKFSTVAT